ncbi:hypothetical protein [Aestuariivivens sediminicola]|uniref:hypothetical protein n=1 Tax=Aestuariivivens sediminicola TaxID=2913560 RepID=UPI001F5AFF65|nr:hypothetical protein [Aestuariivivens sediminicola]
MKYTFKTRAILVFFCFMIFINCKDEPAIRNFTVNYENAKAVSVSFDFASTKAFSIHLKDRATPILGEYRTEGVTQIFTPVVPFSDGLTYAVVMDEKVVSIFSIKNDTVESPELVGIYPSTNELPENLLKMYFQFSQPMEELGESLEHITVFNRTLNKEEAVFLELESELWNKDHSLLTLWLDPGRIKTDLIPNRKYGLPLLEGHEYEIRIDANFRGANGRPLKTGYTKSFKVGKSDRMKPSSEDWEISVSGDKVSIEFNEPLDAILLKECFRIVNTENKEIPCFSKIEAKEQVLHLVFPQQLNKGEYKLLVDTRLEDLAGNNLNRLFDVDLSSKNNMDTSLLKEIRFKIN